MLRIDRQTYKQTDLIIQSSPTDGVGVCNECGFQNLRD